MAFGYIIILASSTTGMPTPIELVRRKVFLSGLPVNISKLEIISFFSKFGEIDHCQLKVNSKTKRSMGYSTLTFKKDTDAQKLFDVQVQFMGRICECKRVLSDLKLKEQQLKEKSTKLLMTGIPTNFSNEDLWNSLSTIPGVSHGYVIKEGVKSEVNKGFGFVTFQTLESKFRFLEKLSQRPFLMNGEEIFFFDDLLHPAKKQKQTVDFKQSILTTQDNSPATTNTCLYNCWVPPRYQKKTRTGSVDDWPQDLSKPMLKSSSYDFERNKTQSSPSFEKSLSPRCSQLSASASTKAGILKASAFCNQSYNNYRFNGLYSSQEVSAALVLEGTPSTYLF